MAQSGQSAGEGMGSAGGQITQCPVAMIRHLNITLHEIGSHWVVLSREVTQSNLHFLRITLDAVVETDCREEWKPGVELGGVETVWVKDDSGLNQGVAMEAVIVGCIWHLF